MKIKLYISVFFTLLSFGLKAQELYGGIEIGGLGIKSSIINIKNTESETYELNHFWTNDIGLAKNLSKNGLLEKDKINQAFNIVISNFHKMQEEHKIKTGNIYIVGSSGIKNAKNIDILVDKIRDSIEKSVYLVSTLTESKFLLRGCVTEKNYANALILDFGGMSVKGGFAIENKNNDNNLKFQSIKLELGTISFTEILNQKSGNKLKIEPYLDEIFKYIPELDKKTTTLFNENEQAKTKENIYLVGGAPWAYCMLNLDVINPDFNEMTFKDLKDYEATLKNNFEYYEKLALTNQSVEKVLKTFNRRQLLAANTLLISTLEAIGNLDKKKIYFSKRGEVAWLISYVLDSAKGIKISYDEN